MKTSIGLRNSSIADYLQRRTNGEGLNNNQGSLGARARLVAKITLLEGGGTQMMFGPRSDPAAKKISLVPRRVERKRRSTEPFSRPEKKRCPEVSLLKVQMRKIVESRWRRKSPGRVEKSSDPFRWFAERLTTRAAYDADRQKIRSMSDPLERRDKNSAEPPGKAAVNLALQFVDLVEKRRLRIVWSAPTADDSIMVVLDTGAVRQEWEFYGDGDAAVMIQKAGGEKRYLDLAASEFALHLPR